MKSSKFVIPFVVSLLATPLHIFLALISTGANLPVILLIHALATIACFI
jgi:hypothetical protein